MRMIGMPGAVCRVAKLANVRLSEEARRRLELIKRVKFGRARGLGGF